MKKQKDGYTKIKKSVFIHGIKSDFWILKCCSIEINSPTKIFMNYKCYVMINGNFNSCQPKHFQYAFEFVSRGFLHLMAKSFLGYIFFSARSPCPIRTRGKKKRLSSILLFWFLHFSSNGWLILLCLSCVFFLS